MASTGVIQRRDNKQNLIDGTPSGNFPDSIWSGPVVTGEFVYAIDTKEIGFLDSTGTLVWRLLDDFGSGGTSIVFKGNEDPNTLPAFGETGDNYMRQFQKVTTTEYSLSLYDTNAGG